jgi:hypothetical protein
MTGRRVVIRWDKSGARDKAGMMLIARNFIPCNLLPGAH